MLQKFSDSSAKVHSKPSSVQESSADTGPASLTEVRYRLRRSQWTRRILIISAIMVTVSATERVPTANMEEIGSLEEHIDGYVPDGGV